MKREEFRRILEGMGLELRTFRVHYPSKLRVIDTVHIGIKGTHYIEFVARIEEKDLTLWEHSRTGLIRSGLSGEEAEDVLSLIKEYATGDPAEREDGNDKTTTPKQDHRSGDRAPKSLSNEPGIKTSKQAAAGPKRPTGKIERRPTMREKLKIELIREEFRQANASHGESFHTAHEGYAVILEEVEEASECMATLHHTMGELWTNIRNDHTPQLQNDVRRIRRAAECLIVEAAQIAAMCQKFLNSKEVENAVRQP